MTDLFKEVIPSILQTKKSVISEENEKDYVPFIVNKALSFHYDCVLHANEMNKLSNLDPLLQYCYMLNNIRGYKRPFQKWQKRETIENLEAVKEYYKYSSDKAKDALLVLTDDHLREIKMKLDRGGLNGKSRKTDRGETKRTR
jgi:hypothetical protein